MVQIKNQRKTIHVKLKKKHSLLPLALQAIREGEGSPAYQALSEAAAQGDRPYPYIIAVDFDGTLCENNWPEIGRENRKMLKVLPRLR